MRKIIFRLRYSLIPLIPFGSGTTVHVFTTFTGFGRGRGRRGGGRIEIKEIREEMGEVKMDERE